MAATDISFNPDDYAEAQQPEPEPAAEPAPAPEPEPEPESKEPAADVFGGAVTLKGWEGWMKAKDGASGCWYYYNPVSGDRQWAPPEETGEIAQATKVAGEFFGFSTEKVAAGSEAKAGGNLVFLDISVGGRLEGRVEIELFEKEVPKTAANFRALCVGAGRSKSGANLHFKNSRFHRIIPGFMCQGGDFTRGDGTGGESIYGGKFEDEEFVRKHDRGGMLSMANSGPNTNGSQFFLTTEATPWLDGKHVVFGKVIKGMEVVRAMEAVGTEQGKPLQPAVVEDCGIVGAEEPAAARAPEEPVGASFTTEQWLEQAGGEGWCYVDLKKKKQGPFALQQLHSWRQHLPPALKVWQASGGTGIETELRHLLPIAAEGWQSLAQRAKCAEDAGSSLEPLGAAQYTEYTTKGFWNQRKRMFQAEEGMLSNPEYKDGWDMSQDAGAVYRNSGLEKFCDVTQLATQLEEKAKNKGKKVKLTRKQIEKLKERKKAIKRRIEKEREDYLDSIV